MVQAEIDIKDLELKGLKLEALDLVSSHVGVAKGYVSYLAMYEEDLEALVGLPEAEQRKGLNAIAHKVIASYKRDHNGCCSSAKGGK